MSEISFSSSDRHISGHVFDADGASLSKPGLLFIHGLCSDQTGYRQRAEVVTATLGITCLTFDLSGHGGSAGNFQELTRRDHLNDVIAAYDQLERCKNVDTARIGVCAASYGAYLACLLASKRPIKRALLRAPAMYDDHNIDAPLRERLKSRADVHAPLLFQGVEDISGESLVLESGNDEVIPHAVIEAYLGASTRMHYQVLTGATHALTERAWRSAFLETIIDWFASL